ncbi:DoxX family protein [Moheibacter lacus]|uniref:DoxX family membrane protein n=1 Tax=Moheibacter lacus TaxID=2745851 RepID=A0A838ZQQ4_9FLAO|nr:DoxX family membrane protein [Moheibacter lacus]MBA5628352.1 DoxX family membrane protein [Moheibacter lacus]
MKFDLRNIARWVLGFSLLMAGIGHMTFARTEFQAQVPDWTPFSKDFVVLASGVVEIILGLGILILGRSKKWVGWVVALFFLAVFPGNISQYVNGIDAFGLDTDTKRLIRLFFQPVLMLWALYACGVFEKRQN